MSGALTQDQTSQDQHKEMVLPNAELKELMLSALERGKIFRLQAAGWSMSPFIRDGDVITIAPLGNKKPAIGEIFAFLHPGSGILLVHRVVGRRNSGYLVQGDNTGGRTDGRVPIEKFLGRVTQIKRVDRKVRLGLGPERYLVAILSRNGLLRPLISLLRILNPLSSIKKPE